MRIIGNEFKKKKKKDKIKLIESQNRLGKFSLVIQDEPKGLGHAVCCASNFFNKDQSFAVILPDDLILSKTPAIKQLIEVHKKTNGGSVIGLEKVPLNKVSNYGVIKYKKKIKNFFTVSGVVEKPKKDEAPSNLSIVGRYILNSKVFQYLKQEKKGFGNEIQLTDSLISLINSPGLYASEFEGKRFDCGSKLGFIEANINFGINDKEINKNLRKIIKKL
ncbi:MAG: UTP--glucose-1-phosphate uridylyltransferase [Pelagibacteraceae bacterium TMED124]|nr:UTP--glucose-1-phosphate uridylyltransferase [Rickettsiales bacterium]RPG16648.1 MAG: UTP--glucose-1-phosphate uridylyltransferase [Pelagibacteraceae bacterium TMED124]